VKVKDKAVSHQCSGEPRLYPANKDSQRVNKRLGFRQVNIVQLIQYLHYPSHSILSVTRANFGDFAHLVYNAEQS
jgi:hypothetical protein